MATHVYFVRHGESDANADRIHRADKAILTEKGIEQARVVGERIKKIGVDALIASPFVRTRHTAEEISRIIGLPIEENNLMVERKRPTAWNGHSFDEPAILKQIKEIATGYLVPGHRLADEENFDDIKERAGKALAFLAEYPAERVCVVTHGIFLRALLCAALEPEYDGRLYDNVLAGTEIDNTGITYMRRQRPYGPESEERWRVISWNDSAHLG